MSNRRQFVKSAAAVGAAFHIVPRHVLGRGFTAPSDMVRYAAIGIGGKGDSDVQGIAKAGASVAALCDVDWRSGRRSFGRFPDAKRYKDYREMFAEMGDQIDAVSVSTPDHSHTPATLMALRAGKAVFCQKPLTRTLGEVRVVMDAARQAGVATQMGNQGHAGEGTRIIREWYEAGAIGEIREIHYWSNRPIWPQGLDRPTEAHNPLPTFDWDLWLGPAPERPYNPAYAPFRWRGWWDYGTGALGDIACHAMDAAFWTFDLRNPTRITPESSQIYEETAPKQSRIEYEFPARGQRPAVKVVWRDGSLWPAKPAELGEYDDWPVGEVGGQMWVGTEGAMIADAYGDSCRILNAKRHEQFTKSPPKPTYARSPGVYAEWINAITGKGPDPMSNFPGHSGPLTEMVLYGCVAVRAGKAIDLAPDGTLRTQVPEEWVNPTYRTGWSL
ncbi:MAG: Gfo/Idh/MocA family oxidoreductase [Gemmatimonadetes bacterium]|nr:Gfo/Idh/MocA family oxidoreductase [Gemmatimonadota bacterium]MCA9762457.1 Gfo/Idh/MocA family oxidoreductase [Gemmatimonadota bacterium]